jgi:prepilin-type N-terminal cleavage/methylation domain-containing protein
MNRQKGYTVTELLVVVAVIGGLVAIILPAVQAARESVRKASCQNNVRQIGVAIGSFEARIGRAPKSHIMFHWYVELLPDIVAVFLPWNRAC